MELEEKSLLPAERVIFIPRVGTELVKHLNLCLTFVQIAFIYKVNVNQVSWRVYCIPRMITPAKSPAEWGEGRLSDRQKTEW